jgi:hypothetical protein
VHRRRWKSTGEVTLQKPDVREHRRLHCLCRRHMSLARCQRPSRRVALYSVVSRICNPPTYPSTGASFMSGSLPNAIRLYGRPAALARTDRVVNGSCCTGCSARRRTGQPGRSRYPWPLFIRETVCGILHSHYPLIISNLRKSARAVQVRFSLGKELLLPPRQHLPLEPAPHRLASSARDE